MKFKFTPALLLSADALALLLTYMLGYVVARSLSVDVFAREFMEMGGSHSSTWTWVYLAQSIGIMGLFFSKGHYTQRSPWWEQVKYMIVVCATMLLLCASVLYILKLPFSRLWVLACFVESIPLLMMMRLVARRIALAMGVWGTDVTLIGGPENVMETVFALNSDSYNVYNIKEIYLLGSDALLDPESLPNRQKGCKQQLIKPQQLPEIVKTTRSELVIAAPDEATRIDMAAFIELVQAAHKNMAFVPPMNGMSLYGMEVQHFFGSHLVLMKPKRRMEKPLNRVLKRGLDLTGACVGLVLLGLPILALVVMIRKDGGTAFYAQERVGRHGRRFKCWKLRSMVPNSAQVLATLLANDPVARKEFEADFKLKNDPRITPIGQFIRKTSLDELPQLWNVIKGDMSLVGPRPIVEKELEYYGKSQGDYLSTKPGLTGLWQVSGRNDTSYAYRVYLDSWYVAHWSIWTDIVIIIQTVGILASRKGAY